MPHEIDQIIGQRIRALRRERNWTQEFLAQQLGILPATVGQMESAYVRVSIVMLITIARLFGLQPGELLEGL